MPHYGGYLYNFGGLPTWYGGYILVSGNFMTTFMGTHNFNNKTYNVYKDTYADLEFIFVGKFEKIFWALLKEYNAVENIPENVLLTGIYFRKNTRETYPNFENGHIRAKYVRK